MAKTIKIFEETHNHLSNLVSKNDTFNDVINHLIDYYIKNEEFGDEEAEFYNAEIEKFENGNMEDVSELTLADLKKRIAQLEEDIEE